MDAKQIIIAVGLVTNENGEILLAKRHQPDNPQIHGKWEFPGGGIEVGENPEITVVREVKEETGLNVEIKRLLPKIYDNLWNWENEQLHVIILSYECKIISGELDSSDEEIGELRYFSLSNIDYQNCLPKTKEIIDLLTT